MRFLYRYQDKEHGVLEGEIAASSESDAYSALRKSGIRPMKVWAKPGFVNKLAALGKRGWAIIALCVLCLALCAIVLTNGLRTPSAATMLKSQGIIRSLPRHQVPSVEVAFRFRSEAALAGFARPGDLSRIDRLADFEADILAALEEPIRSERDDSPDAVTLKGIVAGLKEEVRTSLTARESAKSIYARLVERQKMESAYRQSILERVRSGTESLQNGNGALQIMGFKKIQKNEL